MKIILGVITALVLTTLLIFLVLNYTKKPQIQNQINQDQTQTSPQTSGDSITVIVENLDTPWAIAFLPSEDGSINMLVTERKGTVRLVEGDKLQDQPVAIINNSKEIGEGGLLGITLHPDFLSNNFVYLYYTYRSSGNNTLNRVVRYTYQDKRLINEEIIVDNIPGASNHNGGRIKFGPDKLLYIATGDAQEPSKAQDKNSLAGKLLRVTDEGGIPSANPFNSLIYSFGHRNVQGLTWDSSNNLWATEHGRSGIQSGFDELNLIEVGKNYGWPDIEGDKTRQGMEVAKRHSGATNTWAPSGAAYFNNSIYFSGLRGQALYQAILERENVIDLKEHFKGEFGRIREVILGPNNMLYITTSNRDGRGNPTQQDDRVIRINPNKL